MRDFLLVLLYLVLSALVVFFWRPALFRTVNRVEMDLRERESEESRETWREEKLWFGCVV